ncbi:acetate kinase, partial [Pseudomonas sp. FW301-21B01]
MDAVSTRVLTLNGGSSSVKYGVYAVGEAVVELSAGEVEHADVDAAVFAEIGGGQPDAIGHRIVHGGIDLFA